MNLPRCCFCLEPVLEIIGHKELLTIEQADDLLLQQRAYGLAHPVCLNQAGLGKLWSRRRLDFMTAERGATVLGPTRDVAGVVDERGEEFRLYWDTGYSVAFGEAELTAAERLEGGAIVIQEREYNMRIDFPTNLSEEMKRLLKEQQRYPLALFLRRLKIHHRVMYPQVLGSSFFVLAEELEEYWQENWVSCRLQYGVFIPESGLELLADFGVLPARRLLKRQAPVPSSLPAADRPCEEPQPGGLPQCCLCGAPVLKLEGQFTELTESMLREDDFPMRRAREYGVAHTLCLRNTGLGLPWSVRIREYMEKGGSRATSGPEGVTVLWDPNKEDAHLLWTDGYFILTSPVELQSLGLDGPSRANWRKTLPRLEVLELDLTPHPLAQQHLRRGLESDGSYPLWSLIERLGITEKTLFPELTVQNGILEPDTDVDGKNWRLCADFLVYIPQEGIEAIMGRVE